MAELATLTLDGDLDSGFSVRLEICLEGASPYVQVKGELPPAPAVLQRLVDWQTRYRGLPLTTRIQPKATLHKGSQYQRQDCQMAAIALKEALLRWLESDAFRPIDQRLREALTHQRPARILLRTADARVYQLPWHHWDLIERYPNIDVSFGNLIFEQGVALPTATPKARILAILGHRDGIDVEADRQRLSRLDAAVTFLVEPPRQALNDQLWEQPWDILFFAGHSRTEGERGRIYLNSTDSLTIAELSYGLRRAIAQGLRLAIFNSCDGMGLAEELRGLGLAQIIVMRQPVPDPVAQEFLTYFLRAYGGGAPLHLAVRQAREQLQGLEKDFPCASWLPVIYQSSAQMPPSWSQLQGDPQPPGAAPQPECTAPNPAKPSLRQVLRSTVLIGVAVTGLVTLMRWGGLLEALELSTYDTLVRLSPAEAQDERLLLITVDDQDIEYQAANGMALQGTLSDQALRLLIEALQPLEPQSIGLDVYRPGGLNLPASAADLAIFAICKAPAAEGGDPTGVAPPPDWPISQIGFSDFVTDRDGVLRRHLLAIQNLSPASRCTASNALSLLLALYYLQEAGVAYELTPEREFRFGDVLLRRLTPHAGGYRNVDAAGYQLMLRYRGQRPQDIAAAIPLRQLLSGELSPALIEQLQGRIVLVGSTALTSADAWTAPQSWGKPEVERRVPGVVMQAQMVSQVLSAVLDQRPLLWWWPEWIEVLWIGLWAMVGAGLAHLRRGVWLVPVELGAIAVSCYGILGLGGWVPLVPPVMALAAAAALTRRIVRRRASALPE